MDCSYCFHGLFPDIDRVLGVDLGPMEEAKRSKHCIDQDSRFSLKLWKKKHRWHSDSKFRFSLIFPQPCLFDTSVGKALVDVVERHGKLFLSTTRSDPRRMTERHVPPVDGSWITFKYGFIQVRLKISQLYQLFQNWINLGCLQLRNVRSNPKSPRFNTHIISRIILFTAGLVRKNMKKPFSSIFQV